MTEQLDIAALDVRKDAIVGKLETLRQARGSALLDGKTFDSKQIAAAEAELDALQEAEAEATRRLRATAEAEAKRKFAAFCKRVTEIEERRLANVSRAERHLRAGVAALGAVMADASEIRTACKALGVRSPSALEARAVEERLFERFFLLVRALTVSRSHVGRCDLPSPLIGYNRDDDWCEAEQRAVAMELAPLKGKELT